jgi:predicted metal-dependent HD superfamily phosphohydrolase
MPPGYESGSKSWVSAALFLDADLSVLGWDHPKPYTDYQWGIWKEYEFYTRAPYCEGRSQVLEKMLTSKPTLYFHPKIRDTFEAKARLNVRTEIDSLLSEL